MTEETVEAQHWNAGPQLTEGNQASSGIDSIVPIVTNTELGSLSTAEAEIAVTIALDQTRSMLAWAISAAASVTEAVTLKAFIATIAEVAKQKRLAQEIQLDAAEQLRRSDRMLGLAIRQGQAAGEIAVQYKAGGPMTDYMRGETKVHVDRGSVETLISPTSFFASTAERKDTYTVTDDITEDEFEFALDLAKEEGNLSRRNVASKVEEIKSGAAQKTEKWEQIEEFAARGFTSAQIAKTVGYSESHLRKLANDRGIVFPADKLTGVRRIDPLLVLEKIVASIEVTASSLDLVTYEDVTAEMAAELLERLRPGRKAVNRLIKQLEEI